ncbi:MAG: TetR/AcrR family transcriptional regulator [Dehalococcoidales bacterium]|nr:TetR/AcrR family transcriptional regulator [Dehalococcoidales bacterium]
MERKKAGRDRATGDRRQRILEAALDVFCRKGCAASIPEIARKANVAVGTIYLYFPGKRELFVDVIRTFVLSPRFVALVERLPHGDEDAVLRNIILDRLNLIDDPRYGKIPSLMGEVLRDDELRAQWLEGFLRPMMQRIEEIYRRFPAPGRGRGWDPALMIRLAGGLIIGFLILRAAEGESSPLSGLSCERLAEEIAAFIRRGLDRSRDPEEGGQR